MKNRITVTPIDDRTPLIKHINQNGVRPGKRKLEQFKLACALRNTPALYKQDGKGDEAIIYVKIFDPCGAGTWYLTEFSEVAPDGVPNLAFGYVTGLGQNELGYVSFEELATVKGALGIGLEIDVHFTPSKLGDVKRRVVR
jgi:hypothetical protein